MKRLMNWLLIIVVLYVAMSLFLWWREPSMIYYPSRLIDLTPDTLGLAYKEVTLTASDGIKINGWHLPSATSNAPTLLFFHGNAGNISDRGEKLTVFHRLNANVLIIDYRGYGRSEGIPNELGTYRDALAAYDYLTKTLKQAPNTIIVYGESLGSAIAVELATQKPVGGVVLEEPFTSIGDVGHKMFPFLPVRWLVRNKYDNLKKIGRINAPLLIFHSRQDEIFPFDFAEQLFDGAHNPKHLIELHGSHNDAFAVSIDLYRESLKSFIAALPR